MAKALNDYIKYSSINLTWFAFQIVLCLMPVFIIFFFPSDPVDDTAESTSYKPIMYTLWGIHILHFAS